MLGQFKLHVVPLKGAKSGFTDLHFSEYNNLCQQVEVEGLVSAHRRKEGILQPHLRLWRPNVGIMKTILV